jgi:hypothetical protein
VVVPTENTIARPGRRETGIATISVSLPSWLREEVRVAAAKRGKQMSPFVVEILEKLRPVDFNITAAGALRSTEP